MTNYKQSNITIMEKNDCRMVRIMAVLCLCLFSGSLAPFCRAAGIYAVKHVDGIVWYTTMAGEAIRYNPETRTKAVMIESGSHGHLAGISAIGADDVWFGSLSKGAVYHYNDTGVDEVGLPAGMNQFGCPEVRADASGTLWVSSSISVAVRRNGEWTARAFDSYSSAPLYCHGIQVDADGKAWFVHERGGRAGFISYTPADGCQSICSTNPQLFIGRFNDSFRSLAIDSDGVKWVGTEKSAVIRYRNEKEIEVVELPADGDETLHVTAIRPCDNGTVMVSAGRSLYVIDADNNAECTGISIPENDGAINDFDGDGTRWWIGTSSGALYEWSDGEMTMVAGSAGIDGVVADCEPMEGAAAVYDIMGRRVEATSPGGLYISGGRKFIAR